jgi:hypothetical protein
MTEYVQAENVRSFWLALCSLFQRLVNSPVLGKMFSWALYPQLLPIYIVTCRVVHTTNKKGSVSDDWIY